MRLFSAACLRRGGSSIQAPANGGELAALFLALGAAVAVSGFAAAAPLRLWRRLNARIGIVWAYAGAAALGATLMAAGWRSLWKPASVVTYRMVQLILKPLTGNLITDPATLRVATAKFGVIISPECSGLEGVGLLLLFSAVRLWLYRKECRFPQALLLLPLSVVVLFLLNSVRIAALVLIGTAGAQIAVQGFHSTAMACRASTGDRR
ncbi:MAG TPA: archaeosortase/exosortase family protein [Bryobacteraceae bacterium]|nr:archaeosortase/exosortase family protein [Bryobacteraceae bacterium]